MRSLRNRLALHLLRDHAAGHRRALPVRRRRGCRRGCVDEKLQRAQAAAAGRYSGRSARTVGSGAFGPPQCSARVDSAALQLGQPRGPLLVGSAPHADGPQLTRSTDSSNRGGRRAARLPGRRAASDAATSRADGHGRRIRAGRAGRRGGVSGSLPGPRRRGDRLLHRRSRTSSATSRSCATRSSSPGGIALLLVARRRPCSWRARSSLRVKRLELAAEQVAAGDFSSSDPGRLHDELGQLAVAFNDMQRQLAQLESARKQFIATASHELRTPIFSLGGFVELLEDEELDAETRRRFVEQVRAQVERLRKLSVDLLDLSRLEAGSLELRPEHVDLGELTQVGVGRVRTDPRPARCAPRAATHGAPDRSALRSGACRPDHANPDRQCAYPHRCRHANRRDRRARRRPRAPRRARRRRRNRPRCHAADLRAVLHRGRRAGLGSRAWRSPASWPSACRAGSRSSRRPARPSSRSSCPREVASARTGGLVAAGLAALLAGCGGAECTAAARRRPSSSGASAPITIVQSADRRPVQRASAIYQSDSPGRRRR